jgi:hypothetical protein
MSNNKYESLNLDTPILLATAKTGHSWLSFTSFLKGVAGEVYGDAFPSEFDSYDLAAAAAVTYGVGNDAAKAQVAGKAATAATLAKAAHLGGKDDKSSLLTMLVTLHDIATGERTPGYASPIADDKLAELHRSHADFMEVWSKSKEGREVAAKRAGRGGAAESGVDIFGGLPSSVAKVRGQEAAARSRSELADAKAKAAKAEAVAARLRAQLKGKQTE